MSNIHSGDYEPFECWARPTFLRSKASAKDVSFEVEVERLLLCIDSEVVRV